MLRSRPQLCVGVGVAVLYTLVQTSISSVLPNRHPLSPITASLSVALTQYLSVTRDSLSQTRMIHLHTGPELALDYVYAG